MAGAARTCANCGAPVPVLADVCLACGGDPDLRVLELGAATGKRRPSTGGRGRPPLGWKRWVPIVALVVAVWGFFALTAGGDDDDDGAAPAPTTTTTRRNEPPRTRSSRPRRATTTTIPLTEQAPLLGEETGLTLVVQRGTPHLIDLDTGVTRDLVAGQVFGVSHDRLLVGGNGGEVAWWSPPYDRGSAEPVRFDAGTGTGRELQDIAAWKDPASEVLWVVTISVPGDPAMMVRPILPRIQAFDLDGEPVGDPLTVPGQWPVGAIGDDALIGAPGGTFLLEPDGRATMLAAGQPVGVSGDRVLVTRCEGALRCFIELVDRGGDVVSRVPALANERGMSAPLGVAAASVDGRIAQVTYDNGAGGRLVVDGEPVDVAGEGVPAGGLAWSPDGRWLFASMGEGDVVVLDGETLAVVTTIPSGSDGGSGSLLVVQGISLEP